MSTVRQAAAWPYRVLITLFAAAVIGGALPQGLGIFRLMPGEDKRVSREALDDVPFADAFPTVNAVLVLSFALLLTIGTPRGNC